MPSDPATPAPEKSKHIRILTAILLKKQNITTTWKHKPIIPAIWETEEVHKFKAYLDYRVSQRPAKAIQQNFILE